jgi:hypothetical protein
MRLRRDLVLGSPPSRAAAPQVSAEREEGWQNAYDPDTQYLCVHAKRRSMDGFKLVGRVSSLHSDCLLAGWADAPSVVVVVAGSYERELNSWNHAQEIPRILYPVSSIPVSYISSYLHIRPRAMVYRV